MPSLKDVARLAGVSTSTVSRVISGSIPVSTETREIVERAIRDTNFKPNLVARGLRIKSLKLIGIVVPELQHETFTSFIRYAEEAAEAEGYNLVLGSTSSSADTEERLIENLVGRNVDGIIFSRVSDRSHTLRILERSGIPAVIIDRSLEREDMPSVVLDNRESGAMAARHLLGLGHRRFACISGPLDITLVRDRVAGFRDTIREAGGILEDKCLVEGDFKFESGRRGAEYLLDAGLRFTALWAQNDYMAIGAMNRLAERGLRIPQDISVVGLDNIEPAWMHRPQLTTIAQPFREMCRNAVGILLRMSRQGRRESTRIILGPELIVRETTAQAPQAS
jgi:LacI family transcriptional regulator